MLSFIPDSLKQAMVDGLVNFLANQADKLSDGTLGARLRGLASDGALRKSMEQALQRATARFEREYADTDEDLVAAIKADKSFWVQAEVRQAIIELVARPGGWGEAEREAVLAHFAAVLPERRNRERVDRAVTQLLRCVAEEIWAIPAAKEIREIYTLQLQRHSAETLARQVELAEQRLQTSQADTNELRAAVLALLGQQRQQLLLAPPAPLAPPSVRPQHNLPPDDGAPFVGREAERARLRQLLSPADRAWQVLLLGIGGAGKSALARAIGHEYRERYANLPERERFEAIIWVSAKEQTLTASGTAPAAPDGLIFHTLDDIYATIAQVLERADLAQASAGERDRLAQQVLAAQRTLLIVDNFESVRDPRVAAFLRTLPPPTKALITSREWLDAATVIRLGGLTDQDALEFLHAATAQHGITLDSTQAQQLVNAAGGLPLPLRLAVARLQSGERPAAVRRWLANATGDLPAYCVQSQSELARARVAHAWPLLVACSCFDREAGAAPTTLATVAGLDEADCDAGLAQLLRLSLVQPLDNERIGLLPLVERYIEGATSPAERTASSERWLTWLLNWSRLVAAPLDLRIDLVDQVREEYPNLRLGIAWCREQSRHAELLQLVKGGWFYAELSGRFDELRTMIEVAHQAAEALDSPADTAFTLRQMAWLRRLQGQAIAPTLAQLDQAETLAQAAGDDGLLADIWYISADLDEQRGDLEAAEGRARQMLALAERQDDDRIRALGAYRLAKFALRRGNPAEAHGWIDAADAAAERIGWRRQRAWIAYRRSVTCIATRDFVRAEATLSACLAEAQQWDERRLQAYALQRLVEVYGATGRRGLALHTAEDVRERFARLGIDRHEFVALVERLRGEDTLLAELLEGNGL
jgi:hypothetical protein